MARGSGGPYITYDWPMVSWVVVTWTPFFGQTV